MATTQFGAETDVVANASYAPDPDSSYRFGVTSLQGQGLHNEAFLARYQRSFGPWGIFLRDMGSNDERLGYGDNDNAELFYRGPASLHSLNIRVSILTSIRDWASLKDSGLRQSTSLLPAIPNLGTMDPLARRVVSSAISPTTT